MAYFLSPEKQQLLCSYLVFFNASVHIFCHTTCEKSFPTFCPIIFQRHLKKNEENSYCSIINEQYEFSHFSCELSQIFDNALVVGSRKKGSSAQMCNCTEQKSLYRVLNF